jgi:hypothetical protein
MEKLQPEGFETGTDPPLDNLGKRPVSIKTEFDP